MGLAVAQLVQAVQRLGGQGDGGGGDGQGDVGESPYKSPTDMGVNMVGHCIVEDGAVCAAAKQEIVRRYYWPSSRTRGRGR